MSWIRRVRDSFHKQKLEDQLHDELQFHIEMRTQEFVAAGMAHEEARRRALKQFGNSTLLRERTRDMDTSACSKLCCKIFAMASVCCARLQDSPLWPCCRWRLA